MKALIEEETTSKGQNIGTSSNDIKNGKAINKYVKNKSWRSENKNV